MSLATADRAARILLAARCDGEVIEGLPAACAPTSLADAYQVQDRLFALMQRPQGGWFVGCSNPEIQAQLGLDGPYRAPLLADTLFSSPARLDPAGYPGLTLELEFAFRLDRDLPARDTPYERAEVAASVAAVHPAIEVVASHLADWTRQPIFSLIADNGTDGALVIGAPLSDWRELDLGAVEVTLEVNGHLERQGRGSNVMGDPFEAFLWLVNASAAAGVTLKAGQIHNTGSCTAMAHPRPGDRVVADFVGLGRVDLGFSP